MAVADRGSAKGICCHTIQDALLSQGVQTLGKQPVLEDLMVMRSPARMFCILMTIKLGTFSFKVMERRNRRLHGYNKGFVLQERLAIHISVIDGLITV